MSILPIQAYELKLAPHPAPFSVFGFKGSDALSKLYRYEIDFTSPVAGLPMDQVLGRQAKFIIAPIDPNIGYLRQMLGDAAEQFSETPAAYTIHGIITGLDEFGTSADETHYRVVLEPRLADLGRGITSRLFQQQSIPEIIADTLKHFGYREGVDFSLNLSGTYARREYITQYHETTVAFIQRIAADEGIWFRFEQRRDGEMVVFGDDLGAYARNQRTVPFRRDSGLESSGVEAIKTLERHTVRVPESVRLHDYNHRQAGVPLLVEQNVARDDPTTNAVDYHWGEHYRTPEEGRRVARLRHEAHLAGQITYIGSGNPYSLAAGEVIRLDSNPVDAPHGLLITSVAPRASRKESFWLEFTAIPADRTWRPAVEPEKQPSIDGILPARITSPGNYQYAYLTQEGWYVIVLPFDLDEWSPGGTSRPVRFAKPYSGDTYGHHFPLIDGAEVALVFTGGDPDRPVIVGAMHDSLHPDLVTNLNNTRNLIRTAAQNEMRMEDQRGIEHVHLATPFQVSELNLGHMVDGERKERGRGVEVRTDGHLAARAQKGMLLSTEGQPGASGQQLAMTDAKAQLQSAIERMETLSEAVRAAEATVADLQKQKALYEHTLDGLKRAAILMSGPAGIGFTSGEHLQINADQNLIATAGGNFDVGIMRNFTVAAGTQVSVFAQARGIRLTAAKQDIVAQARTGAMSLASSKDMQFTSIDGAITAVSKGPLTLTSGGAYLKLDGGNIELGCPGDILLKCANFNWTGPASLSLPMPTMPIGPCKECLLDAYRGVEAMTEVA